MKLVKPLKNSPGLVITKGHSSGGRSHHAKKSETPIEFVGVDGEGMTVNGCHRYVLFGVGDRQIQNPEGLQWNEVFQFLYGSYKPSTGFVGFFLGYDFTQIFKTLPEDRARMLLTTEGIAARKHRLVGKPPHPVEYDGWQFDLLGNKRLRLRPKGCECPNATCECKHDPWMYVCDVGPFFQTSFLNVINPKRWEPGSEVVSQEEYELIERGKTRRSEAVLDDEMRMYNRLENEILVRVMKTLDRGFHDIGIHLPASKWFGPGQAAQAWLTREKVPTREEHFPVTVVRGSKTSGSGGVPPWFFEASRMSYFGGWFEPFIHGLIPEDSYEYDVNSAYPSIIADLPCLLHGTYSYGVGLPDVSSGELAIVYGDVWGPGMPGHVGPVGAMLHRDRHGRILRPGATRGWFWWHELRAAERARMVKRLDNRGAQQITKWVKYLPCDCPPPMRNIRGLYQKRLEVGKNSPIGMSCKLVYNSDYGKFAQSIGDPLFGNPIYASLITAGCRTMILDAIATHPDGLNSLAMVATDGVYFMTPHPSLPLSDALGEWGYKVKRRLTIFKPGVYWDDTTRDMIVRGESPHFKARGFKASDFAAQIGQVDEVFTSWISGGSRPEVWPSVEFRPGFAMVTALQALRRNDWGSAGRVTGGNDAVPLVQNAAPWDKRCDAFVDIYDGRTVVRSRPYRGLVDGGWVASEPYEKRFGMENPWSDVYKGMLGETPDGFVGDVLAWILKGE
jgi:hypothetical protein